MKSKLHRLQESLGNNITLIERFTEQFSEIPDNDEFSPSTDIMVENFCKENNVELIESYDISSLNLKKGTVIEMTDLEDILNLTGGKFRKELSLFVNDGGVISFKVIKDGVNTVNGISVYVEADGVSTLANESQILKFIKDKIENGDLSYLVDSDGSGEKTELEKMSLVEMLENLSGEDKELLIESVEAGRKQEAVNLLESFENGEEPSGDLVDILTEAVSEFYSLDTPEGMVRQQPINAEDLSAIIDSSGCRCKPSASKGVYFIESAEGDTIGLYNNNTEELDLSDGTKLMEEAVSKAQQALFGQAYAIRTGEKTRDGANDEVLKIVDGDMSTEEIKKFASTDTSNLPEKLTEASEQVRVATSSADKFRDMLKSTGVDFSRVSKGGSFDDFFINEKTKSEIKTMINSFIQNGGKAVLVERIKETDNTEAPKEYADVIVENENGEILLMQRSSDDEIEPSKLGFAGGKIEEGETPEVAAKRELFEETGIEADQLEFVETYINPDGSISHYYKTTQNNPQVTFSDEHAGIKWVAPQELVEMDDIMFGNNDRYCEVCGVEKSNLSESENKIDVGSTVKDASGKEWKAEEITSDGFKMVSGDEEKIVAFADIDSFLGSERITESIKVKSVFRLKESITSEKIQKLIEEGNLDEVVDNIESAESDSEDISFLEEEMVAEDGVISILSENTDEFGDTISLVKDDTSDEVYVVESTKCNG